MTNFSINFTHPWWLLLLLALMSSLDARPTFSSVSSLSLDGFPGLFVSADLRFPAALALSTAVIFPS